MDIRRIVTDLCVLALSLVLLAVASSPSLNHKIHLLHKRLRRSV